MEDTPEKKKRFAGEVEWMNNRWGHILWNDPFYNPNLSYSRDDFSLGHPARELNKKSAVYSNAL